MVSKIHSRRKSSTRTKVELRSFLLDEYNWKGKEGLVSYLFSNNFQNRLRASAHAGHEGEKYDCPFCQNGLLISKEAYKRLQNELAKFGEIRVPELVAQSLQSIMKVNSATAQGMVNKFKGYSLLGILYHSTQSKLNKVYGFRSKIRKKTEANYKQIVNGVDVKALTYNDIKDDIAQVTKLYGDMLDACPACLGFGYLDVGHKSPQGKVVHMLQLLYARYKRNPEEKMYIEDIWEMYHSQLAIFPQLANRPTQAWAESNLDFFTSHSIDKSGELTMANRFNNFTSSIKSAITAELARIRSLIEKGEVATDSNAITFEEAINFYAKLIRFTRVSTGTLKKKLHGELQRLNSRYAQAQGDDTLKIKRDGRILHALPERFLWVQGATQKERRESGVEYVPRMKKGKMIREKFNANASVNKFRIYGAFLSDDSKFGYGNYTWGRAGQTISGLLSAAGITGEQVKFAKVFPQILED